MERLGRWDEALESRKAMWRLEPENVESPYRAVVGMLFAGKTDEFQESWAKYHAQCKSQIEKEDGFSHQRDRLAKPRLLAGGPRDESFNTALEFADANYETLGFRDRLPNWRRLCKGIAEYRRGEPANLRTAIKVLDTAFNGFKRSENFKGGAAITRFIAAMAHHKLGNEDVATKTYLDGLDRHNRDWAKLRIAHSQPSQSTGSWPKSLVAKQSNCLKVDLDQIDPQITDTSDWQVVLEANFDESVSKDWKQLDGQWSVVDGAVCGSLEHSDTANEAYARLEREIPGAPSTFEVEYETWTSDPMLAACFLRQPPKKNLLSALGLASQQKEDLPVGLRIALASHPDRLLTDQGIPGKGINLLTHAPFGFWINRSVPEFNVKPNQHYQCSHSPPAPANHRIR